MCFAVGRRVPLPLRFPNQKRSTGPLVICVAFFANAWLAGLTFRRGIALLWPFKDLISYAVGMQSQDDDDDDDIYGGFPRKSPTIATRVRWQFQNFQSSYSYLCLFQTIESLPARRSQG